MKQLVAFFLLAPLPVFAQQHAPGAQGSRNVTVAAHIPLAGELQVEDIEIEQELSRPYAYYFLQAFQFSGGGPDTDLGAAVSFTGWNGGRWGVPNISSVQDWDRGPRP